MCVYACAGMCMCVHVRACAYVHVGYALSNAHLLCAEMGGKCRCVHVSRKSEGRGGFFLKVKQRVWKCPRENVLGERVMHVKMKMHGMAKQSKVWASERAAKEQGKARQGKARQARGEKGERSGKAMSFLFGFCSFFRA